MVKTALAWATVYSLWCLPPQSPSHTATITWYCPGGKVWPCWGMVWTDAFKEPGPAGWATKTGRRVDLENRLSGSRGTIQNVVGNNVEGGSLRTRSRGDLDGGELTTERRVERASSQLHADRNRIGVSLRKNLLELGDAKVLADDEASFSFVLAGKKFAHLSAATGDSTLLNNLNKIVQSAVHKIKASVANKRRLLGGGERHEEARKSNNEDDRSTHDGP